MDGEVERGEGSGEGGEVLIEEGFVESGEWRVESCVMKGEFQE
jgi:hypothetical protein